MVYFIVKSLSAFLTILQAILACYIFIFFFSVPEKIHKAVEELAKPMLMPFHFLLKHSVFGVHMTDLIPVIAFMGLMYLKKIMALFLI